MTMSCRSYTHGIVACDHGVHLTFAELRCAMDSLAGWAGHRGNAHSTR
jgi:hypothetical protein